MRDRAAIQPELENHEQIDGINEVYFDVAATTPISPAVKDIMMASIAIYGNPSSLHHKGLEAEAQLMNARKEILCTLGTNHRIGRIVFTSGGTEANNLAIFGSVNLRSKRPQHIVTTAIEHKAVLEPLAELCRDGCEVTYVQPCADGDIRAADVLAALREDTVLVTMMHVNNETGAILPVEEVGKSIAANPKIKFHVDGTQAHGKIPIHLPSMKADMYTVSGHKIGGPKGIGALYVRNGLKLAPRTFGGNQEHGMRAGTENVLGAIAMAQAVLDAKDAVQEMNQFECEANAQLLIQTLLDCGYHVYLPEEKVPFIISASLPGLRGEVIVHALESVGLYVSTGSACSSKSKESHVLAAMGISLKEQMGTIRISFLPRTTRQEIDFACQMIQRQTNWLKQMVGR